MSITNKIKIVAVDAQTMESAVRWGESRKKYINGQIVEMTADEIAEIQESFARAEVEEKKRPLTEAEVSRMIISQQINTLTVDDQTALRMRRYYPTFAELVGKTVTQGTKFRATDSEDADLYKTIQPELTIQAHYPPGEGTESLYTRIDETHDGSKYDPIPYEGNMALENGKHYVQNGVTYLCNRDTGNPVYNALSELVGLYVELV